MSRGDTAVQQLNSLTNLQVCVRACVCVCVRKEGERETGVGVRERERRRVARCHHSSTTAMVDSERC